jgi:hypothetical protein
MIFALLLLFSAATRLELIPGDVYEIPRGEWRYFEVDLNQRVALVDATFRVEAGSDQVRVALLRRDDLERMRNQDPFGVLAETATGRSGSLRHQVRDPGDYVMVLDNRDSRHGATVRLSVWLDFAQPSGPYVTRLTPARRLVVVFLSCAVFFAVVTLSARRLWQIMKR